ncbi:NAD(P)-binding domain-containing protein [Roseococcus sp.]|uniref:NAD(P)-binding domain-containing protein n=1 Tax=Roseococcus sp. TaxID=2109646 RepID=UPI003BACA1D0
MNQTARIAMPLPDEAGLAALETRIRRDLELLTLPASNWVPPLQRDGVAVRDVVVVGAGMAGIAAAGSLIMKGIGNIAVLDANAPGQEGPWCTIARMDTLRSPKTLPGPCLGIPSLTFRAWYEASFGNEAWESLYKIFNRTWQDYLSWLQRVLALPVTHGARVTRVAPAEGLLRLTVEQAGGSREILARRVVMATGRGGAGGLDLPRFVDPALFPDLAGMALGPIDFEPLQGRSIGIVGGGASAWDNAAVALERGAARVDMYVRRAVLPQINKGRGSAGAGFAMGWDSLSVEERWKLAAYMYDSQAPVPHETVHRALRQPEFHIHLGTPTQSARREGDQVVLRLGADGAREERHDFLIVGTGFSVNLDRVAELADFAPHAARWQDVYTPPEELRRPDIAACPFVGAGFELLPRDASAPPELGLIHLMNYGSNATHGNVASDIPAIVTAGEKVSVAILRHLFQATFPVLMRDLEAFDEPELLGTPFYVPR